MSKFPAEVDAFRVPLRRLVAVKEVDTRSFSRREFLTTAGRSITRALAAGTLAACAGSPKANTQPAAPAPTTRNGIRPPNGQVLFIAGQGQAQLGGRPLQGLGDGYLDHIATPPGGFTLYTSVAAMPDFAGLNAVCGMPALQNSVLHLSVAWVSDTDLSTKINNRAITLGAFDQNIDRLANWCALQRRPILLRIGYEYDRAFPIPGFHYDPDYFAQAFRRVVNRIRAAGADNVSTVMGSANPPGDLPWLPTAPFDRFYPGDDYVDWLGCSMWRPADVATTILSEARKRRKPVLLAETTPTKFNIAKGMYFPFYAEISENVTAQQIWNAWHKPMIEFIRANRDVIAGWHYIADDWSNDPMFESWPPFVNCDARPWASGEFLEIWNAGMKDAMFLQASPKLFQLLGF
jgi:hypothetical protein